MGRIRFQKLDALRGFAALYIIVHNCSYGFTFLNEPLRIVLFGWGQEVVMIFFLLSGFVICWSYARTPHLTFQAYLLKRFSRIYIPFLVAILLSLAIALDNPNVARRFSWMDLFGNLALLQDLGFLKPGTWFDPFLGNLPLWTLTYEWWFYILFYLIYKTCFHLPYRLYLILTFSISCYGIYITTPNQIALIGSYFIIWWAGAEAADILLQKGRLTFQDVKPILGCLLVMVGVALAPIPWAETLRFGFYPFLMFRHFFAAFLLSTIAWFWYCKPIAWGDRLMRSFTLIAPISYGLYVFHYPILIQWRSHHYFPNLWLGIVIKIAVLVGLSYAIEGKLQPLVSRWVNRWVESTARSGVH